VLSGYKSQERENIDIIGQYRLSQIETDINGPMQGGIGALGTGIQHAYDRNLLQVNILNAELKGGIELQKDASQSNFVLAGLKLGMKMFPIVFMNGSDWIQQVFHCRINRIRWNCCMS
jgi:hypothetical protein